MRSFIVVDPTAEIVYPVIMEMVGKPSLVVLFTAPQSGIALMRPATDSIPLSFTPEYDWAPADRSDIWRPYAGTIGLSNS